MSVELKSGPQVLISGRRASAVYRIARFPTFRSEKQRYAWAEGKKVFYKGGAYVAPGEKEATAA